MSIIWLEPFVFDPTGSNIFTFQSLNIMIYLNMISIICFVIYSLLYKSDPNMQKPPNTLLIWKMFGECLISFHFLVLFLCFSFENNKRKLETTNTIMYLISLISPLGLFITYFFNACLAHNLYITFYTYRNNFDNRMKIYKVIALVGGIITLLLSILFNNRENHMTVQFAVSYYPFFFIALVYFSGGLTIFYMLMKIFYVIRQRGSFFSFLKESDGSDSKKMVITLFVKRHLLFLLFFFCAYVPNNVILLLQIFMSYKLCTNCSYYSVCIYMMSLSCTVSFLIKMTEPYMKKYVTIVVNFLSRKEDEQPKEEHHTDYIDLYSNNGNALLDGKSSDSEMNVLHGENVNNNKLKKKNTSNDLTKMADTLNVFTKEMEVSDFFSRMIGITVSTEEDKQFDFDPTFNIKMKDYLPWEDSYYSAKSKLVEYSNKNLPEWMTKDTRFPQLRVTVRKYAPLVFHHLRVIDGFTIKDVLASLDPNKNLKIINESFACGGRSANPIIFTHDKKFLLKTISKEEKNILITMLPEFHRRMRDCSSFLCRIYGVFRIKVSDKENAHILLMKNMNDLPSDTRVLTFDLKGSTVDRNVLDAKDKEMIMNGKKNEVIQKYSKKVLKDNDFKLLDFKFKLSKRDAQLLQQNISLDAEFLKGYNLTDYSLLLSIHKYTKEVADQSFKNYRIIKSYDGEYLYNFSVIDYLTEYNLYKMGEKLGKGLGGIFKGSQDRNFSVQDPLTYSRRFIRYVISNIQQQDSSVQPEEREES